MRIPHTLQISCSFITGLVLNFVNGSFYGTNLNRAPNIFYEIICSGANAVDLRPYWVSYYLLTKQRFGCCDL